MNGAGPNDARQPTAVDIYTDGACSGNPGPGGWCAILRHDDAEKEISGGERGTTSNRMEMTAAIRGLQALKRPCRVRLVSDSQSLVTGMTEGVRTWVRRGWVKSDKKPVLNRDLWESLVAESARHRVEWVWVEGHAGHEFNERCDKVARQEISKLRPRSVR